MDFEVPHRRRNPLTGDWVLVSPHRARRPWQGGIEKLPPTNRPAYDPGCYLCPGNPRVGGARNPAYEGTYVFDNDFPALLRETGTADAPSGRPAWMETSPESGVCRVVCYSPRHDLSLGELDPPQVQAVVDRWIEEVATLSEGRDIGYVQVFENRGEVMGCSNPHPHGQIWASRGVPHEVAKEDAGQLGWARAHGECLLCSVARFEAEAKERLVLANEEWVAVVPFWAVWPFETLVLPRRHASSLLTLDGAQRDALAHLWRSLLRRYDRLFDVPMPLSCGWHLAPEGADARAWHAPAHFYPPLLRSATVKKFMVGYEMLGGPQRDLTPEQAAGPLREAGDT